MYPPILVLFPDLARDMLSYRIYGGEGARAKAREHGYEVSMSLSFYFCLLVHQSVCLLSKSVYVFASLTVGCCRRRNYCISPSPPPPPPPLSLSLSLSMNIFTKKGSALSLPSLRSQGWHCPIFPYVLRGWQGWHWPIFPMFLRSGMVLSFATFSELAWTYFPYVLQGLGGPIFPTIFWAGMVLFFPTFSWLAWSCFPYVLMAGMVLFFPTFSSLTWSYFSLCSEGWHDPIFPYVLRAGMVLFSIRSHGWHGPVFPYVLKSDMVLFFAMF